MLSEGTPLAGLAMPTGYVSVEASLDTSQIRLITTVQEVHLAAERDKLNAEAVLEEGIAKARRWVAYCSSQVADKMSVLRKTLEVLEQARLLLAIAQDNYDTIEVVEVQTDAITEQAISEIVAAWHETILPDVQPHEVH